MRICIAAEKEARSKSTWDSRQVAFKPQEHRPTAAGWRERFQESASGSADPEPSGPACAHCFKRPAFRHPVGGLFLLLCMSCAHLVSSSFMPCKHVNDQHVNDQHVDVQQFNDHQFKDESGSNHLHQQQ